MYNASKILIKYNLETGHHCRCTMTVGQVVTASNVLASLHVHSIINMTKIRIILNSPHPVLGKYFMSSHHIVLILNKKSRAMGGFNGHAIMKA